MLKLDHTNFKKSAKYLLKNYGQRYKGLIRISTNASLDSDNI